MSENITHTAVNDDCFRLMSISPKICDTFQSVGREHLDIARLGAVTRSADRFTPQLFQRFRDGWLDRLFNLRQRFSVSLSRYADAFYRPDSKKYRRYIVEDNIYNPQDPLIQLARAVQSDEKTACSRFTNAFESTENTSKYALALALGTRYLHAASQYFTGNLGFDVLKDRLDNGKSGG